MYNVYLISSTSINGSIAYKIGRTKRQVIKRLRELETGNENQLVIENIFRSKWGTKIEAELHRKYCGSNRRGEWFDLNEKQVEMFINDCQAIHDKFEFLAENNTWFQEQPEFKKFI